jgi:hypothetical protein
MKFGSFCAVPPVKARKKIIVPFPREREEGGKNRET